MTKFPKLKKALLPTLISVVLASHVTTLHAAESTEAEDAKRNNDDNIVVIVGGKIEQSLDDIAGSVSVMTLDTIEDQAVSDMSDLFRYEPGVEITGSAGTAQNFIIRGMGADRVMMVKDGMRMNEGFGANGMNDVVGRGFIDVDTVKQVEVAKGASSSLFGADALGGVVVFTTKDPSDYLSGEDSFAKVNIGTDGRSSEEFIGVTVAAKAGPIELMLNAKNREGNGTQNYDQTRGEQNINTDSILFKAVYPINDKSQLSLSVDNYEQSVEDIPTGGPYGNYANLSSGLWAISDRMSGNEKETTSYSLNYKLEKENFLFFDSLNATVYQNDTNQFDFTAELHGTSADFVTQGPERLTSLENTFIQDTQGFSLALYKEVKTGELIHRMSYGFDLDKSDVSRPKNLRKDYLDGSEPSVTSESPFPRNETTRQGVYFQDQMEIGNWQIIPGIRFDDFEMIPDENDPLYIEGAATGVTVETISEQNVSPRLGAIYSINENLNFYAQYSTGFKTPPYDLAYISSLRYFFSIGYAYGLEPAEDLLPEESDSYEIGLRGNYSDFNFTLSAYYNDYTNMIEIAHVRSESLFGGFIHADYFQYQNIESAVIQGFEASGQYVINDNFAIFANLNSMDATNEITGEYLSTMRPLSGVIGLSYMDGNFSADLNNTLVDHSDDVNPDTMESTGYIVSDLMINYQFTSNLKLNLSVLNLFDREYIQYSSQANVPDDTERDWSLSTQPGTTVSLRIDYIF